MKPTFPKVFLSLVFLFAGVGVVRVIAWAQEPAPVPVPAAPAIVGLDTSKAVPGSAWVLIVNTDRSVTLTPFRQLIVLNDPGGPGPNPTPDPNEFQKSIQDMTARYFAPPFKGTKQSAAGLSAVYSLASKAVADGSLPGNRIEEFVNQASDLALKNAGADDKAAWAQWRVQISGIIGRLDGSGDLATRAQWTALLNDIHVGIDLATGVTVDTGALLTLDPRKAGILSGINLADLIALIKLILELLLQFKGP